MIVLLHVVIAFSSMISAGYTYFRPSKNRLRISEALVALTLASGTYLIISTHSPILQACEMGLIYLGATLAAIIAAYKKVEELNPADRS